MKVEIRAASFESRSASGRKGDVVEIPDDPGKRSPAERHGLATGNLVAMDLKPVRSAEAPPTPPAEGKEGAAGPGARHEERPRGRGRRR